MPATLSWLPNPGMLLIAGLAAGPALGYEPVRDPLVVLTFDDAVESHSTVAAALLKRYGFGATFFVSDGFGFATTRTCGTAGGGHGRRRPRAGA